MPNAPNRQASVDSRRIALEREIAIRVPAFDSFVTEYSTNISTTGMFIVSEKPQPPGTTFAFEFSVADDWKLIRGRGQVVWARYRSEGPNRPSGMGVRFTELDAQSRRLIRWIVEKHIREGGKPFELDELRSVIDEALEQVLDSEEAAEGAVAGAGPAMAAGQPYRAASSASGERRRRLVPLLLTAVGVATVLGLLLWWTERAPRSARRGDDASAEAIAAVEPPAPAPAPETEPAPVAASGPAATAEPREGQRLPADEGAAPAAAFGEIGSTVAAWSKAWSDQNVERYLSFYSPDFKPPGGLGFETWKAQRRERLTSPEFIRVAITALQTESVDETRARALFFQSYRSDRLSDTVRKVLELAWQDDRWMIVEEKVVG